METTIKIVSLLLFCYLSSCKDKPECFKSTGSITQEERSLDAFKTIHLEGNINLIFTDDSVQKVTVEAGEHLLEEIRTEVKEGQLFISNDNSCNWVRSYKKPLNIYISLTNVKDIFHYGSGNITSRETIHKDTIIFHHYSSGDINLNLNSNYIWLDMDKMGDFTLSGKTHAMLSTAIGLGKLNTLDLICKELYLTSRGMGSSEVRSDSLLSVEINNTGNVYYTGNPVIIKKIGSGSGSLIQR